LIKSSVFFFSQQGRHDAMCNAMNRSLQKP
jgi:hypothetical protein